MSQRDLVAELRAAQVGAPAEVRARVRLIAAAAPSPPRRLTWRRALAVAVPVAAAVAASVVFTRPSHDEQTLAPQVRTTPAIAHGSVMATPSTAKELAVPTAKQRVQVVGTTLSLRTGNVSDGVKRAVRIVTSLGGYPVSVHAETQGKAATADLKLRVPRSHVQQAMSRLAQLGTIVAENVDVQDRTATLNATDRTIARLQKRLADLRAANAPKAQIAAVTRRIEALQRSEAATRRAASFATVDVHLETPRAAAPAHEGHGPLHGIGVAFRYIGIGAAYVLAIGGPAAVLLLVLWLAVRVVRRRREHVLLSR
jgi:uncharacterized protein DUF4349